MLFALRNPLLVAILLATFAGGLPADLPVSQQEGPAPLTAAQKTAALRFAQEHHPQLSSLIRRLEKRNATEYERALTNVSKAHMRLARVKSRDQERYHIELSLWKVDSRIRLLAARMASSDRNSLESQLRSFLNERTDLRLQQLALDRNRLTARLDKIDDQISRLSTGRDAQIDKDVERLRRSVRKQAAAGQRKTPNQRNSKSPPKRTSKKQTGDDASASSPGPASTTKTQSR